jgi:hypothetical protein
MLILRNNLGLPAPVLTNCANLSEAVDRASQFFEWLPGSSKLYQNETKFHYRVVTTMYVAQINPRSPFSRSNLSPSVLVLGLPTMSGCQYLVMLLQIVVLWIRNHRVALARVILASTELASKVSRNLWDS